jgi:seryl-tRNA synthetase
MADDAHEERFRPHEAIMEGLARMLAAQHTMNERQEAINEELKTFNRQQVEINQDGKTTLARIETLLARMIPQSENGREA